MARAQNAVGRLRLVCFVTSSHIITSRALMASGVDCGFEELLMCLLGKVDGVVWEGRHAFCYGTHACSSHSMQFPVLSLLKKFAHLCEEAVNVGRGMSR